MLRIMAFNSGREASVRIVLMLGWWMGQTLLPAWAAAAPLARWELIAEHPHDRSAFTQGLTIDGDRLIEGTGLYGQSRLLVRSRKTGQLLFTRSLPEDQFGEGVAVVGERIIQLTWMNGIAHVFDRELRPLSRFRLSSEGWGLTFDGTRLIRSDGSSKLRFHDARNYTEIGTLDVTDNGRPIANLNELEFIDGQIYANVWLSDRIAIIDPASGHVRAWLDLTTLSSRFKQLPGWDAREAVLNGIARIPENGHLLVTGKLWPLMFELAVDKTSIGDPVSLHH
ncbi:MAG: glutaminyl-peptide cyclotransferase [Nevskia sp.]|uniref:glutaminyl-peptide cyclotransferase n=1 Tax=Nevskia sp. TaxID=1929292 RepID=UPI0040367CEF